MSKRIFTTRGITFTAVADGLLTTGTYMAIKAASNQLVDVLEVMVSGMAVAATLGGFVLKRASTNETTPTALAAPNTDGLMLPTGTALVSGSTVTTFIAASTQPTASVTVSDATLQLGLNAFGGILRWNAAPGQEWKIQGSAAPGIESVMYNSTNALGANAAANAHIIYEPY